MLDCDSDPLLDGQNATANKMAGTGMLTSQCDFDPVLGGLDRERNIAVTGRFVSLWTMIHIPDRRIFDGHGSILLQHDNNL